MIRLYMNTSYTKKNMAAVEFWRGKGGSILRILSKFSKQQKYTFERKVTITIQVKIVAIQIKIIHKISQICRISV